MSKVSIIIVNWNGLDHLKTCLDSVYNQTDQDFEVIFVDDASSDDSVDFVKQDYPQVKVIRNKKNLGFAEGNNVGIREALKNPKIKYIACLNNDTEVSQNWLLELVKTMESEDRIGLCASKILYFDQRNIIDSAGDFYYQNTLKVGPRGHLKKDDGQYGRQEECLSACAAAALYRREMLEEIKLGHDYFDSDYFAYIEDSDLALRARLLGWKCVYAPKAIVYHKVSATTSKLSFWAKKYFSLKNRLFTIIKIYPVSFWLKALKNPVTYQKNGLNLFSNLWLYIKVFVIFLVYLPKLIRKRRFIQNYKKVSKNEIQEWLKKLIIT